LSSPPCEDAHLLFLTPPCEDAHLLLFLTPPCEDAHLLLFLTPPCEDAHLLLFLTPPSDYPPPPPPAEESTGFSPPSGSFPPPPVMNSCDYQVKGPEKTLQERRSSLDAEIDSLTSILADLESSSPYKPRVAQNSVPSAPSTPNAPVTGYKRMVIPTQPPLTATKKSTPKPQAPGGGSSTLPSSASPVTKPQIQTAPQPVPASYATASTPSQPTFNVQMRSAQPGPQHQAPIGQHFGQQPIRSPAQVQYMPAQPKGPDFAYGPPQPGFSQMAQGAYQDQHHPGVHQVGGLSSRRAEPAPAQDPRKTYITDVPPSLAPYTAGPAVPPKGSAHMAHPEDELERLTKKMLFDMDHPPSEEYFGRCASCGDNVVGEGTGCTAMDQVFHVDCFVCMTCSSKLRGKPFYAVEKKAYSHHSRPRSHLTIGDIPKNSPEALDVIERGDTPYNTSSHRDVVRSRGLQLAWGVQGPHMLAAVPLQLTVGSACLRSG
ncbi:hypothetical protein JOQ06_006097, partial [Pogonophryne albipinna]